jgi:glutamate synthase domain-containing protein 3
VADDSAIELNCAELTSRELAKQLRSSTVDTAFRLVDVDHKQRLGGVGAGLSEEINVDIHGSVGDFLFLLGGNATFSVRGHVGDCSCHSMLSGQVVVHGNAGRCLAAYATGGFVAVLGNAGDRCGQGLAGADVLVRSKVGNLAGLGMRDGALVLGNGAGEQLGQGMTGGVIYVRGEVKSKAETLRSVRLKDADTMRLSLLLARAGIKANGADFKAYRAKAVEQ